jgi:hypothetical protein
MPSAGRPQHRGAIFVVSILLHLTTRFVGLEQFPITFFADEAAQTVIAAYLIEQGFQYEGELLPPYFLNVNKYSLSVTVYSQVFPY